MWLHLRFQRLANIQNIKNHLDSNSHSVITFYDYVFVFVKVAADRKQRIGGDSSLSQVGEVVEVLEVVRAETQYQEEEKPAADTAPGTAERTAEINDAIAAEINDAIAAEINDAIAAEINDAITAEINDAIAAEINDAIARNSVLVGQRMAPGIFPINGPDVAPGETLEARCKECYTGFNPHTCHHCKHHMHLCPRDHVCPGR